MESGVDVLAILGTRPELIKILPCVEALQAKGLNVETLSTGQHATLIDLTAGETIPNMPTLGIAFLFGLLAVLCAACAGAVAGAMVQAETPRSTASPQALEYFERMMRAHDSTGVEQAACVTQWNFAAKNGVTTMHVLRVSPPTRVLNATFDGVTFECGFKDGTVHTHSLVCIPSDTDREGDETFGVVVCPRPTRFAVFAVTPKSP